MKLKDLGNALPGGVYEAVFEDFQIRTSSSNLPYIGAYFRISGGDYDGRRLWDSISLTKQADWKIKEFLTALGVKEDEEIGDPFQPDDIFIKLLSRLKGKKVRISVILDTSSNRNDIESYYPYEEVEIEGLDELGKVL